MQSGPAGANQREVTRTIPPGAAYILTGVAQGRTAVCEQRKVAHGMCSCCWTHGIWNEGSALTRESITMRVFDSEWGRDVILNAVEVVEAVEGDDDDDDEMVVEAGAVSVGDDATAGVGSWIIENLTATAAASAAAAVGGAANAGAPPPLAAETVSEE